MSICRKLKPTGKESQMSHLGKVLLVILYAIFCVSASVRAESSAEKLLKIAPNNVLGIAITSGGAELKPAFDKTILGKICNDPQTKTFINSVKNELLKKASQTEPNAQEIFNQVWEIASVVSERPMIGGAALKTANGTDVLGFLIIADPNKARTNEMLSSLEKKVGPAKIRDIKASGYTLRGLKEDNGMPLLWGWAGNYFVCTINDANGFALKYIGSARATVPTYLNGLYGPGDALGAYVNTDKIAAMVKSLSMKNNDTKDFDTTGRVMRELGLANVTKLIWRFGFAGQNITADCTASTKAPHTGLLACLKPVTMSMFNVVDANAAEAAVWNFDLAQAYDTAMKAVKAADPCSYDRATKAIAETQTTLKFNIRQDLLANIAGPMVFYTLPAGSSIENPSGAMAVVAQIKDGAKLEEVMNSLGDYIAASSKGMMQAGTQTTEDGKTLHTWMYAPLAMMRMSPCWMISDKNFIFATSPALCADTAKRTGLKDATGTFASTETFKTGMAKRLQNTVVVRYVNSRVQFMQLMNQAQQFWPILTMGMAKDGINIPAILPNYSAIAKEMGPAWEYGTFDADGFRVHASGQGVGLSGQTGVAGTAMALAILMPALAKTRDVAYRMVSGTNLVSIGKAMIVYANDYNDVYPATLQELVDKADLSPKTFESKRKPAGFTGPTYIYITGQKVNMPPDNVLVYENPGYAKDGVNVLFNDAHVEFMKFDEFKKALEKTYKNLGKAMPENLGAIE
jgi:hypothetical protein